MSNSQLGCELLKRWKNVGEEIVVVATVVWVK